MCAISQPLEAVHTDGTPTTKQPARSNLWYTTRVLCGLVGALAIGQALLMPFVLVNDWTARAIAIGYLGAVTLFTLLSTLLVKPLVVLKEEHLKVRSSPLAGQ